MALAAPALPSHADNYYWNTGSGNWTDGVNWSDDPTAGGTTGVVPIDTDQAIFNQSTVNGPATISLTAATPIGGLTFRNTGTTILQSGSTTTQTLTLGTGGILIDAAAGAVTIGNATNGTAIALTGGAQTWTNNSASTFTTLNAITLGANPLTINGTGVTTLGGAVGGTLASGTTALTVGGTATLNLTANNGFTGDISIDGGTLVYTGGTQTTTSQLGLGASGSATYKRILLDNGGTFRVANNSYNVNVVSTTNRGAGQVFVIGPNGGTFDVNSGLVFTVDDGSGVGTASTNAQLQGSGTLTKTGLGVLSLGTGANSFASFTGQINVNAGVLRMGNVTAAGIALGDTSTGTLIASGAALDIAASNGTAAEPVTINGTGAGVSATYNAGTGNGTNAIYSGSTAAGSFAGPITLGSASTIGTGNTGALTLSGGFTGAHDLTFRNLNTGALTLSTAPLDINGSITNASTGTGGVTISSTLGANVSAINQSGASTLTISSANPTYAGAVTVSSGGLAVSAGALTTNEIRSIGSAPVSLNGGTLLFAANGSGALQTIVTGDGVNGANITLGGTAAIDVNRVSANSGSTIQVNNLNVGTNQLNVTGGNTYRLRVAGTTTIGAGATLNPTTAQLNLGGRVVAGSNDFTVSGAGATRLLNVATGGGANSLTGTVSLNGGSLQGFAPAAGAVTPTSNSLGTATIAMSGTNPVLNLAASLNGGLTVAPTAGLAAKGYQVGSSLTSLANTNFMGPSQAVTPGAAFAHLTVPAGGGTVANLPTVTASTAFPATTSFQFVGLLNITTPGIYNFSTTSDDGGTLFVDGNSALTTGNSTATGSFYLTAGLHTFTERVNNNGSNGTVSVRYQGPDTSGALIDIPAGAFFQTSSAQLATNFGNNISIASGTNATINVVADTNLGSLTTTGSSTGSTLNLVGGADLSTVTFNGTTTLSDHLTIANSTVHAVLNGNVATTGGTAYNLTKTGFGNLTIKGSYAPTGTIALSNAHTTSFQDNGTGNNGTIARGNLNLNSSGITLDVRNNGANTGNTVAFGALTLPATATQTATTFTGGNGYNLSFTSLALPGGTGQNTYLNPTSTNVSIGNVTNQMSGFVSTNFDTLFLDGTTTANAITGNISDAAGGSIAAGGTTRITKQGTGTWTLSGTGSSYVGVTTILNGTLRLGASNVIPAANVQGVSVNATGAGLSAINQLGTPTVSTGGNSTATLDLNGFNQTLNGTTALTLAGGAATNRPRVIGTGSTLTINGGVTYTATNNPLGGQIELANLDLGGGSRTFNVGLSTSAGTIVNPDLSVTLTGGLTNGTLVKTGTGVLFLSGSINLAGIQNTAGTIALSSTTNLNNTPVTGSGSVFDGGGTTQLASLFTSYTGTLQNIILSGGGGGSFLKQGPGTLTLASAFQAGTPTAVTINQGLVSTTSNPATPSTLALNFNAAGAPTTFFDTGSTLTLGGSTTAMYGGGALALTGKDNASSAQAFTSTLVDGGASTVSVTAGATGSAVANLGTVTRNVGGTVAFVLPAGTQSATNGVRIGGSPTAGTLLTSTDGTAYGTVGDDWAAHSTDSPNNIVAATVAGGSGASILTAANSAGTFSGNANITGSFTATSGSTVDSIRFNTGTSLTLTLAGVNTVNSGGVLFGSGITTNATITGGSLRPGAGRELVFINNEPGVATNITTVLTDSASGASSVTFRGNPTGTSAASFNVNANNTYTGPTFITASRVNSATAGITTPFGTGPDAIVHVFGNQDGQFFTSQNVTIANPFVIVGTGFNENNTRRGAIRLDSSATNTPTLSGPITLIGDASIGNNAAITAGSSLISGDIGTSNAQGATSFVLTKVATGVIRLTGNNTHTATNINGGAINVVSDSALGVSTNPLTFTGNSRLQLGSLAAAVSTRNIVVNTGVTGSLDTNGFSLTNPYPVSGPGIFGKAGAGTLTIASPLGNTGGTAVIGGTLYPSADNVLPNAALVFGQSSTEVGTLDLTDTNQTVASMLVQSNTASANQALIGAGKTLRVNGLVSLGINNVSATSALQVSGPGTFTIGAAGSPTNANVLLGNNTTTNVSNAAILDLSGISTFYANLGTGTFRVGDATNSNGTATLGSTLTLSPNSTILATTFTSDSPDSGVTQTINLGSGTNVINANTLEIAGSTSGRSSSTFKFGSATGTLLVRDLAGTGRTTMNIAHGGTTTGAVPVGLVDLSGAGHSADLLLSNLNIGGRTGTSGGNSTGTLIFDNGTLDATGVLLGNRAVTATTGTITGTSTGTLTLGGGAVTIGATGIRVAPNTSTAITNASVGTVNIAGAAVTVGATGGTSITLGSTPATPATDVTSQATLNITGGSLAVAGNIVEGTGTPVSTILLNGGTLDMGGFSIGSATASIDLVDIRAGALRNAAQINNGAGFTKTSTGTLLLGGTNTYTGVTTVAAGTLGGTGSATSAISVAGGATLMGGDGMSILGTLTLSGGFTLADNSAIQLAIGPAGAHSTLARTGGTATFDSDQGFTFLDYGATVGTYDNIITGLAADPGVGSWVILTPGIEGSFTYDGANVDLTLTAVPEPAAVGLLAMAGIGLLSRRRRRM